MSISLSIIIPTKNRYETLFPLIEYLETLDTKEVEVVVQDNSKDNSKAINFLNKNKLSNVKYYYEPSDLSVIGNSDLAVKNATGKYICFIGDDDGVMPYILDIIHWMDKNNINAVSSFMPNYFWPNLSTSVLDKSKSDGKLLIKSFSYRVIRKNTENGLLNCLNNGGTTMEDLPMFYHGIVKKKILDDIYNTCKTYFPGPSPDMAVSIAISLKIKEFIFLDFPLIISGKCIKSTGGKSVLHQHLDSIDNVPHLPKNTANDWTNKIPKYWTAPTIWAESVVKSLENLKNNEWLEKLNYDYLYARLYVFQFSHKEVIFKNFSHVKYSFKFYYLVFKIFLKRVIRFLNHRYVMKKVTKSDVKDIKVAIKEINNLLDISKIKHSLEITDN